MICKDIIDKTKCTFQLSEQFGLIAEAHSSTKTMQNRMEVAWDQERTEQKRLLAEAHCLAMDMQEQLRVRDAEHARERKALLDQLKRLRTEIDDEQMKRDTRVKEVLVRGCEH